MIIVSNRSFRLVRLHHSISIANALEMLHEAFDLYLNNCVYYIQHYIISYKCMVTDETDELQFITLVQDDVWHAKH